jgi:hypothetical protein
MKSLAFLRNAKMRFCIAIGAASGIGHVLFRAFTENLGPINGLLVSIAAIGAIAAMIALLLEWSAKRIEKSAESL